MTTPTPVTAPMAGLQRWAPRAAEALEPDRAEQCLRAWLSGTPGAGLAGDVSVHDALVAADGLSVRYSAPVQRGGRPPRELTLLLRVARDGTPLGLHELADDPALPTLRTLLDPERARALLGRTLPGTGRERGVARVRVQVVHHPRRGACVLRYDLRPGAAGFAELPVPRVFAKVYPDPGEAERKAGVVRALHADATRRGAAMALPRVLGVVPDLRVCLLDTLPGVPLIDLLRPATAGCAAGEDAARAALRALAGLHAATPRPDVRPRTARDELDRLESDVDAVAQVWPEVAAVVRRAVEQAAAHLAATAAPLTVAHGDFTPSQVLLHEGVAGLVDLDTVCRADPALDLGRFIAYLELAAVTGKAALPVGLDLVEEYRREADGRSAGLPARAAAHRTLALAHVALSAMRRLKEARLRAALRLLTDEDHGGTA